MELALIYGVLAYLFATVQFLTDSLHGAVAHAYLILHGAVAHAYLMSIMFSGLFMGLGVAGNTVIGTISDANLTSPASWAGAGIAGLSVIILFAAALIAGLFGLVYMVAFILSYGF